MLAVTARVLPATRARPPRVAGLAQGVAEAVIGEVLGQFRKQLQVLLGEVLRHGHREHQVHRFAVGGAEVHRRRQPQERGARLPEGTAPAMRDGDPVADRGAAQAFALAQALRDRGGAIGVVAARQQPRRGVQHRVAVQWGVQHGDALVVYEVLQGHRRLESFAVVGARRSRRCATCFRSGARCPPAFPCA